MKFLAVIMLLSVTNAFATPNCKLKVLDRVGMPNGPVAFPEEGLNDLRAKGYSPVLIREGVLKKNEMGLIAEVHCQLNPFNPFISSCKTEVSIMNDDGEVLARGTREIVNFGVYSGSVSEAIAKIPNCKDL